MTLNPPSESPGPEATPLPPKPTLEECLKVIFSDPHIPASSFLLGKLETTILNPFSSMRDIAELVGMDPGLTSRIVVLANSAVFRGRNIQSLESALNRIGMAELRRFCLNRTMIKTIEKIRHSKPALAELDFKDFWYRFILSARINERILLQISEATGWEYLLGLMHEIGSLFLNIYYPEQYATVEERLKQDPYCSYTAEKDCFGFTHEDLIGALAPRWKLPDTLVQSMGLHHHPLSIQLDSNPDARLMALSLWITDSIIATQHLCSPGEYETEVEKDALPFPGEAVQTTQEWKTLVRDSRGMEIWVALRAEQNITRGLISELEE